MANNFAPNINLDDIEEIKKENPLDTTLDLEHYFNQVLVENGASSK